jgi:hypothetical protein
MPRTHPPFVIVSCPADEMTGLPLYNAGSDFSSMEFRHDVGAGCFPEGTVVRQAEQVFLIHGRALIAVEGEDGAH